MGQAHHACVHELGCQDHAAVPLDRLGSFRGDPLVLSVKTGEINAEGPGSPNTRGERADVGQAKGGR